MNRDRLKQEICLRFITYAIYNELNQSYNGN